jgi:hypothetical protein
MGPMAKIGFIALVLFAGWKFWTGPSQIRADVPYPLSYPLTYRTHVVGQADSGDRLPLLIVLHGAGAHEEDLDGVFED